MARRGWRCQWAPPQCSQAALCWSSGGRVAQWRGGLAVPMGRHRAGCLWRAVAMAAARREVVGVAWRDYRNGVVALGGCWLALGGAVAMVAVLSGVDFGWLCSLGCSFLGWWWVELCSDMCGVMCVSVVWGMCPYVMMQ